MDLKFGMVQQNYLQNRMIAISLKIFASPTRPAHFWWIFVPKHKSASRFPLKFGTIDRNHLEKKIL